MCFAPFVVLYFNDIDVFCSRIDTIDFYTKLGKCRTFTENVIDDLKEKSNTNFSTKIDERTLYQTKKMFHNSVLF